MKLEQLKINGVIKPIGYQMNNVILSWKVVDAKGVRPVHTSIDVSNRSDFSKLLFHIESDELEFEGTRLNLDLKARTTYYVQVAVED